MVADAGDLIPWKEYQCMFPDGEEPRNLGNQAERIDFGSSPTFTTTRTSWAQNSAGLYTEEGTEVQQREVPDGPDLPSSDARAGESAAVRRNEIYSEAIERLRNAYYRST